jgi:hypothetical protein
MHREVKLINEAQKEFLGIGKFELQGYFSLTSGELSALLGIHCCGKSEGKKPLIENNERNARRIPIENS